MIMMKFQVTYNQPKKKGLSKQKVVFYNVEDAFFWQKTVEEKGCINVEILPLFGNES